MDLASLIGIAAGLLVMALAMMKGGALLDFVDPMALLVTLGGTLAATAVQYPLPRLKGAALALKVAFFTRPQPLEAVIATLAEYAQRARVEGVLALEEEAETARDPFLRKALSLAIDGTDPDDVRAIMDLELAAMQVRHRQSAGLFETMASYAPAFGMAGTLIALVKLMQAMNDPSALGAGMAAALLSALYGVAAANLLFHPIAGKLKLRSSEEILGRQIILEGVLGVYAGDQPGVLVERLNAFLAPARRTRRTPRAGDRDEEG